VLGRLKPLLNASGPIFGPTPVDVCILLVFTFCFGYVLFPDIQESKIPNCLCVCENNWQKNYNNIFFRGHIFDMQVANTNMKNLNMNYHHEVFTCCF